ncbi:hypothetical protein chiPu_0024677, partial [Chiloscyllium punctatum]|nr:hypothetical protein [Chiloscyllium punctatum]
MGRGGDVGRCWGDWVVLAGFGVRVRCWPGLQRGAVLPGIGAWVGDGRGWVE